ncbi:MAG: Bax inhibitor-1/YccA family protein [Candidatus Gracilibacteria bacterium]|nr:Bax inhibitor-1/YccA family protein [Candidatus Gracilibacteria bacterium]
MFKSGNPALKADTFTGFNVGESNETMTLEGTTNKSYILLGLVVLFSILVWNYQSLVLPFFLPIIIVNLVLGFVIIWKKELAPTLAPIYAILEGIFIGVISSIFELKYPGIIIQAISLTFGVFLTMLVLYQTKIIKPTENFKLGVVAATGGIAIIYLISLFGSATGLYNIGYIHEVGGIIGILISVFIVTIAALNLVLDFDFIESGVEAKVPKYMEWYAAFGLLVTLVWLYLEILRLLSKSRD